MTIVSTVFMLSEPPKICSFILGYFRSFFLYIKSACTKRTTLAGMEFEKLHCIYLWLMVLTILHSSILMATGPPAQPVQKPRNNFVFAFYIFILKCALFHSEPYTYINSEYIFFFGFQLRVPQEILPSSGCPIAE